MKQGYEGIAVAMTMLLIAFAAVAVMKWLL